MLEDLPWARHYARTCTSKLPSHLDHENLQSAGVLGYLKAASRYDISRGASFRGFCAVRIRGAVLDELRRWDWAPRSVHRASRRITKVTRELSEQLDREPTGEELAEALGMEVADLASYRAQVQPLQMVSFDEAAGNGPGEDGFSLAERLPDATAVAPDAAMLLAENQGVIRKCVNSLPEPLSTVIVLHYLQSTPLRDVAARLKISPSRVSQLHHQALPRIRQLWEQFQAAA